MTDAKMLQKNKETDITKISQNFIDEGIARKSKHLLITGVCNNNCIFCFSEGLLGKEHKSLTQIKKEIREGIRERCEKLVLSGGEPTIHPGFLEIVRMAKEAGYRKVQVITNGRMFAYAAFLNKAVKNGLDEISFSIHTNNQETGDYLSGSKGSFEQSMRGLGNALEKGLWVQVKIVLNRHNLEGIGGILDCFHRLGVGNFEIISLVPEGNAWKNRDDLFFDIHDHESLLLDVFKNACRRGMVINLSRFDSSAFAEIVGKKEQFNKKFNELFIRKKEYIKASKKKRPLPCFGEKCLYCFIKRECMDIQGRMLSRTERLPEGKLDRLFTKTIKESSIKEMPEYILADNSGGKMLSGACSINELGKIQRRLEENLCNEKMNIDLLGIGNNKRLAKLEHIRKKFSGRIARFCRNKGYFFRISEEPSMKRYCNIYISGEKGLVEEAEKMESRSDAISRLKFGSLLGYPSCCVKKWFKHKKNSEQAIIKDFFIENNGKKGSFCLNRFSDFVLIGHVPHSLECRQSIKAARQNLKLLGNNFDSKEIIGLNKRAVISIGGRPLYLEGNRKKGCFYYTSAYSEFNKKSVLCIFVPKTGVELAKMKDFCNGVVSRVNLGEKIRLSKNSLQVYKGSRKIFTFFFPEKINYIEFA